MELSSTATRQGSGGRWRRSRPGARGGAVPLPYSPRLQRSTVKWYYAPRLPGSSWAAHGVYLARGDAGHEGTRRLGFDAERDDVDLASRLGRWHEANDIRLWTFIVSPEHSNQLDLRAHTRCLVTQMEHDLGTALHWAAIDHYDTSRAHIHLVVRGRADDRSPLTITRGYLNSGLRLRSEELATSVLGFRSERELILAREQTMERPHPTEIDRAGNGPWGLSARMESELRRVQFAAAVITGKIARDCGRPANSRGKDVAHGLVLERDR